MAQLATIPCPICRETILMDKHNLLTNFYINTFIMKTNTMTEVMGYEAPNFDVVLAVVERGFEVSYGDFGEAGGDFGSTDFGEF